MLHLLCRPPLAVFVLLAYSEARNAEVIRNVADDDHAETHIGRQGQSNRKPDERARAVWRGLDERRTAKG